jgi:hypothetical protein
MKCNVEIAAEGLGSKVRNQAAYYSETRPQREWRVLCEADWHADECSGAGPRASSPQEAAELAEEAGWWHDTRRGRWVCPHHLRESASRQ